MKIKWDSPLPKDIVDKWVDIKQHLNEIEEVSLDRCYLKNAQSNDCEIHCFTDSSTRAYAAVVYVVGEDEKSFVIGKSRLVPIKDQEHLKIPRLELLGALIGSRLIQYVTKFINLNVSKQVLWTDSQIVIDWFNSNKLLTPFVSRRIEEIKRNKNLIVRYVPSELNPADAATRPTNSIEDGRKWLTGPDFLLQDPNTWPTHTRSDTIFLIGEDLTSTDDVQDKIPESMVVENEDNSHDNHQLMERGIETDSHNTLEEIRKIQSEYFKEEVNGKETCLSRNLGLFKDVDGILRCKGRFRNANWSFDKRYPMIIPKDCNFTNKVIKDTHERNYHVGASHTLSIIRQTYWIPQGKRQVLKILKKCPRCSKHGGGPFKLPPTPALPYERVNYSKAFTFTGVDYLGPVLVKTETGTSKRWICLFTCLAVRAIHLEVVQDLSAEEGLSALRRMCSTRGVPELITSDNALHFKLISDIVSKPYCVQNKIKWRFIPELAPWFGAFYERLVGLVKHCMRRTLQKHLLNDSQLSTIVKEIEAVLNTRPLTSVDAELEFILKPSDFLQPGRCLIMETAQNGLPIQGTSTKTNLIKGWKKARTILQEFEEMFQNRYLPSLRERYNHSLKQPRVTSKLNPQEGQIVQIKGDKNREGWKVGKIISLIKGSDGLVRVAQVKVGNSIFTRSIAHLYPLEAEDEEQYDPVPQDTTKNSEPLWLPSEQSVNTPDVVTENVDDIHIDTCSNNGTASTEDIERTYDILNVTNKTAVTENENENDNRLNELINDDDKIMDNESLEQQPEINRPRRTAAVRALQKIREWTRNLMITLQL
ncbi:uncharacterized protein LOC126379761 [Pectinophora gossypiella]|uniref:uncharacterized protein LOC126379761 n=1 Tax=Pectinophora gossypiella TaxID=13191 RepID=UPI00214EFB20|nr:uncharacterized protein LOC126379761 [Pectinophora gossypiella]